MCQICNKISDSPIEYVLCDNSIIEICSECNDIIDNANLSPIYNNKYLHISNLIDYVELIKCIRK